MISSEIQRAIQILSKMPGMGQRTARRAILYLLKHRSKFLGPFVEALETMATTIHACHICGNYSSVDPCSLCVDERREQKILCVVEDIADMWALERTGSFKGVYHVLGGVLSALDGVSPEDLRIPDLLRRLHDKGIEEVILALNATVEGQTTSHYLQSCFGEIPALKVTALAHGVPLGGELDYLDDATLSTALLTRRAVG